MHIALTFYVVVVVDVEATKMKTSREDRWLTSDVGYWSRWDIKVLHLVLLP